ncbi:Site-specific recombinase XerD [Butyrivibrio sp. INlla18]|uniref:tyrosine-type recombinase/integrase n=1 Tax=Butyrivibrio sp. INlla18 TaxID=1520806 RepID=UPI00087ED25C|nr:site-specific integrase [Butyrivibrio sp. INlla18]SDA79097.1 Site-specific recombinase XerD [Butyrivibrio sp. INlla18]
MPRKGENIRLRKDGRWEGRYSKGKRDGKPLQGSVFGKTYKETKEKLVQAKAALKETNKTLTEKQKEAMKETFQAAAEEWLEYKEPIVKESSMSGYQHILEKYLIPEFGDRIVVDITRDDVTTYSTKLLANGGISGKGLSPKTVSGIISVLKNVIDHLRRVKCVPTMEFDGLALKQPQKQLRVFSHMECDRLTEYLLNNLSFISLGILLSLYTGLRIGELCALKWGDISFDEHKLHVERTLQRIHKPDEHGHKTQIIITTPKSDCSVRDIPIPDDIYNVLVNIKQPDDCFFLTGSESFFVEPRCMENHFNRVMKECVIEGATMHTCRHSFATICVELGFDIKSLSEILGHASVSITLNRYVHPSMEMKQENMNRLSEFLRVKNRGSSDGKIA